MSAARGDLDSYVRGRLAAAGEARAGSRVLHDFGDDGAALVTGTLIGRGPDVTSLELAQRSSTRASLVPPQSAAPQTNPLVMVKSPKRHRDWCLAGVTITGRDQGHNYSLLRLDTLDAPLVHDVTLLGGHGDAMGPPGETHVVAVSRCTGSVLDGVRIDGRGDAATGIGHPRSRGITMRDVRVTGCAAWGTAFFEAADIDTRNLVLDGNGRGLNHERCDGPIRHAGLWITVPVPESGARNLMHMTLLNDRADNPDVQVALAGWSGGKYGPDSPFCVRISDSYRGVAQRQTTLPRITGPDGAVLRWADAGRSASPDGRFARVAPRDLEAALADPRHWAVRHH